MNASHRFHACGSGESPSAEARSHLGWNERTVVDAAKDQSPYREPATYATVESKTDSRRRQGCTMFRSVPHGDRIIVFSQGDVDDDDIDGPVAVEHARLTPDADRAGTPEHHLNPGVNGR